jgi:hypothetical protein
LKLAEFDDLQPWEQYELLKMQMEDGEDLPDAGRHVLTFWKQILLGTFTGDRHGASPATLARLMKIFSDADLLLPRLAGMGAIRLGLWFDPKFAREQADEMERRDGATPQTEMLRQLADAVDEVVARVGPIPPLTPHLLFCAMLHWVQDREFSWAQYEEMMPLLFKVKFTDLIKRLHLGGDPARTEQAMAIAGATAQLPVRICAPVFVRFENRFEGTHSKDFGPYAWVEIVHNELKVAPAGRHLATMFTLAGKPDPVWLVADPSVPVHTYFTNVIIGPAEVPEGWTQPDDPEPHDNVPPAGVALPPAPGQ